MPARVITPWLGRSKPASMFKVVVLPEPDGPTAPSALPRRRAPATTPTPLWPLGFACPPRCRRQDAGGGLRRELGATFALSWPLVLANLAVNVMPAINAMMLGWLSPRALAAGSLGFSLLQPPFVVGVGVVAALSPIAAAKIGAGATRTT